MSRDSRPLAPVGLLATVFVLSASGPTLPAQSDDPPPARAEWTKWGGPHGNFIVDSAPLADRWPDPGPPVRWSRPLGAGHSAILFGDGRLFTMYRVAYGPGGGSPFANEETVIALDPDTGHTLWEHTYESDVQGFGQGGAPHATPLLVDGRVFAIGTNKKLHVLDAATGEVLWARDLVADFDAPPLLIRSMIKSGYGASPLAYRDTIIAQVGGPGQSVMAFRQDDGQVVWAHPHDAGNDFNFQVPLWGPEGEVFNRLVYRRDRPVGPCQQWAMPCKAFPQHVAPE